MYFGGFIMAFKNKKLNSDERNAFKERRIVDFLRTLPGHSIRYIDPLCVTVDEERDIYLISLGSRREESYVKYFSLVIGGTPTDLVLSYEVKQPDIIIWSIKEIYFSNDNMIPKEQILDTLKCSLSEFRWTGYEESYINGPANVKFNF